MATINSRDRWVWQPILKILKREQIYFDTPIYV